MKMFKKILAYLSMFEGVIHLVVSVISLWGIYELGTYDWRIMTAPIVDFVFGFTAIAAGIVLGEWGHKH